MASDHARILSNSEGLTRLPECNVIPLIPDQMPKFIIVAILSMITSILIIGYELQVRNSWYLPQLGVLSNRLDRSKRLASS
jgi:hypothetical protein